jgi:hypothetical protein
LSGSDSDDVAIPHDTCRVCGYAELSKRVRHAIWTLPDCLRKRLFMSDSPLPTARHAASWFALFVAVLAMSVPYMEYISGVRAVEMMNEEFDAVPPPSAAVFKLPQWTAAAVLTVVMLGLVIKEFAIADATAKIAVNLAVAVLMLVVGGWLDMLVQAAMSHVSPHLMPLDGGPL